MKEVDNMATIQNFQPTELIGLVFENPDGTFAGEIEFMDSITIDNGATEKELRSGVGNGVLYSVSSEFTSDLSGECIMSADFFKIITSNAPTSGTQTFTESESITASGTTLVLAQTPSAGAAIHVFPVDVYGRRETELKVGTPATNATDYSISGKNITVHSSLSGKTFKVIYKYDKAGTKFSKKAQDSKVYKVVSRGKCVDLATNEIHVGQFVIPSFKPSVAFQIGSSNADFVKASISGKCLVNALTKSSWDFIIED